MGPLNPWIILTGAIGFLVGLPIIYLASNPKPYVWAIIGIMFAMDCLIVWAERRRDLFAKRKQRSEARRRIT
jgi:hypothetical protein